MFPFTWCGIFIPVLPETLMDVLDAPVPFLVGIGVDYLRTTLPEDRPDGVVFVNLDTNTIHLGIDDTAEERNVPRMHPNLPKHDYWKLIKHLNSLSAYLPDCQKFHFGYKSTPDGFPDPENTYSGVF